MNHFAVLITDTKSVDDEITLNRNNFLLGEFDKLLLSAMLQIQVLEALRLQNLILYSLEGFDAPLRSHHHEDFANVRARPQQLLQNHFAEEACASGNQHVLPAIEFLYI